MEGKQKLSPGIPHKPWAAGERLVLLQWAAADGRTRHSLGKLAPVPDPFLILA